MRIPEQDRRGRGAVSNAVGRFEPLARDAFDDGWAQEERAAPLRTEVGVDAARTVLARNQSPDLPFDRSVNPYRGCEHGCVYCFARPSHAYLGLSPGLDFETKLFAKPDAAARLAAELARPSYRPAPIAIGTNTDPYQPIERTHLVTRSVLRTLWDWRHPVSLLTKNALILRDLDLLSEMAAAGLARAALSVTTLDRKLARDLEPRAPTPARRLEAIEGLARAGVPVGLMMGPVIPGLNDHELEAVFEAGRDAGAAWADYVVLRLPREVAELFKEWLRERRPEREAKVMTAVRSMFGGRDYDPTWRVRQRGDGPVASLIAQRARLAKRRFGLEKTLPPLRTDLFGPPEARRQLALGL
ncbi:MAG: PA0069 family radical SAM protein [Pseudomonadota bacterium]